MKKRWKVSDDITDVFDPSPQQFWEKVNENERELFPI